MKWSDIPNFEQTASGDDNPFAYKKNRPAGKISVAMPPDDWLCGKMEKLNVTVSSGYPSATSDAAPLARDQFVKFNTGASRWNAMHEPSAQSK